LEAPLLYLAGVLGLGTAAQWLAWRFRLPAILLLLLFGFAAGYFADPEELIGRDLLFSIVSLSVAVILFEGGLSLRFGELRETGQALFRLVTVGILVTWLLTTVAARLLLGFELGMAALAGAILVVTGPTVIMPLLRQVRPIRRVGSLVKWEGIVNDPIGAVLAVLVFEAVVSGEPGQAAATAAAGLAATVLIGTVIAAATAATLVGMLRRYWIPDYLQNVAFLTAVVLAFAVSNFLQPESGLVTVTLLGIILANQKAVTIQHVVEFKENLRVLLISCLFILLASRLKLNDLTALGAGGGLFLAAMLFVVRPAAVFLSTLGTELRLRERLFLAWLAPRGIVAAAVSSVFALQLAAKGHPQADQLVWVTFLVIAGTVAVYGLTAAPLANWLKIAESNPQGILFAGADPFIQDVAKTLKEEGYQGLLVDTNQRNIAAARMAGLPTCWASVLSGYVREEVDLGGIGRLLAMTPNDQLNALAAQEFAQVFGRAEVYRLPTRPAEMQRQQPVSSQHLGRLLFDPDATYSRLAQRFAAGAVVKKTTLSEEFDYAAFADLYGDSAILLFLVDDSGKLTVVTADAAADPAPGQTVIALVDRADDAPTPGKKL